MGASCTVPTKKGLFQGERTTCRSPNVGSAQFSTGCQMSCCSDTVVRTLQNLHGPNGSRGPGREGSQKDLSGGPLFSAPGRKRSAAGRLLEA